MLPELLYLVADNLAPSCLSQLALTCRYYSDLFQNNKYWTRRAQEERITELWAPLLPFLTWKQLYLSRDHSSLFSNLVLLDGEKLIGWDIWGQVYLLHPVNPEPIYRFTIPHREIISVQVDHKQIAKVYYLDQADQLCFVIFAQGATVHPQVLLQNVKQAALKVQLHAYDHTFLVTFNSDGKFHYYLKERQGDQLAVPRFTLWTTPAPPRVGVVSKIVYCHYRDVGIAVCLDNRDWYIRLDCEWFYLAGVQDMITSHGNRILYCLTSEGWLHMGSKVQLCPVPSVTIKNIPLYNSETALFPFGYYTNSNHCVILKKR